MLTYADVRWRMQVIREERAPQRFLADIGILLRSKLLVYEALNY